MYGPVAIEEWEEKVVQQKCLRDETQEVKVLFRVFLQELQMYQHLHLLLRLLSLPRLLHPHLLLHRCLCLSPLRSLHPHLLLHLRPLRSPSPLLLRFLSLHPVRFLYPLQALLITL